MLLHPKTLKGFYRHQGLSKLLIFAVALCFSFYNTLAQGHGTYSEGTPKAAKVDSLKQLLLSLSPDDGITRATLLFELGKLESRSNPSESYKFLQQARAIAFQQASDEVYEDAIFWINSYHRRSAQYDSSKYYCNLLIDHYRAKGDSLGVADAYNHRGVIYRREMQFTNGAEDHRKAIELYDQHNADPNELAMAYTNLGRLLHESKDPQHALEALHKAYEIAEQNKEIVRRSNRGMPLYFIGIINMELGDIDAAQDAMDKYAAFAAEREDHSSVYSAGNHGSLSLFLRDSALANKHLIGSLDRALASGQPKSIALSAYNLAGYRYNEGFVKEALRYANIGAFIAQEDTEAHEDYLELKYKIHEALNQQDSAYFYLKSYHALRDSLSTERQQAQIKELEVNYKTKEQQQALALQEIQLVQASTRQRNLLIFFGLLAIAAGVFLYGLRQRTRLSEALADQRGQLLEQEREQHKREQEVTQIRAMLAGQETERSRIAQDLHDSLGGLLASTRTFFERALIDPEIQQEAAQKGVNALNQAYQEVRRIAHAMMPQALSMNTFTGAVEDLIEDLENGGLHVTFETVGPIDDLISENKRVILYRILQELITNTLKHAKASNVILQLIASEKEISMVFEDDGIGFEPKYQSVAHGLGLSGLESRVKLLKGNLDIASQIGAGTSITINFPTSKSRTPEH